MAGDRRPTDALVELLVSRTRDVWPLIVGITGSVAVGKTAFAEELEAELAPTLDVAVVSTDGFLFPNDVLNERGLLLRKGFPETFDIGALDAFVVAARSGAADLAVPVYDHSTFDIVPGERRPIVRRDVILLDGVLLPEVLDVSIYLDADVADIERWFVDRFVEQVELAASAPGGFYDLFVGMSGDEVRDAAAWTCREINLPNLLEHIEPHRSHADIVVTKAADHSLANTRF